MFPSGKIHTKAYENKEVLPPLFVNHPNNAKIEGDCSESYFPERRWCPGGVRCVYCSVSFNSDSLSNASILYLVNLTECI